MMVSSQQRPVLLPMSELWEERVRRVHFAYQPIVERDGRTIHGIEALLRGVESAGFDSIPAFFDLAHEDEVLHAVDLALRHRVLTECTGLIKYGGCRLFYNLDARCVIDSRHTPGQTEAMLEHLGLDRGMVVLEINEQHPLRPGAYFEQMLETYRDQGYRIALDDYGVGFSHLQSLFMTAPDYLKIDRYFVDGIDQDPKRQFFVRRLIDFARDLGSRVVVEGVETAGERDCCIQLGADFLQGYLLCRPTPSIIDRVEMDASRGLAVLRRQRVA